MRRRPAHLTSTAGGAALERMLEPRGTAPGSGGMPGGDRPAGRLPGALPNLVVVGAMKCGTSSLHYYLDLHPEVAMSSPKELDFFLGSPEPRASDATDPVRGGEGNFARGLAWYSAHFDPAARIRGESSPNYADPLNTETPRRMAAVVPEAKLVFLARHPVDRIVSNYLHLFAGGRETASLEDVLARPGNILLRRSRYAAMAGLFLGSFPREQILFLRDDELLRHRRETMRRTFAFLGVDDSFWSGKMERLRHETTGRGHLRRYAERLGAHRLAARLALGPETKWRIERLVSRPRAAERPALSDDLRRAVLADLEPEIAGLERLTGWDLAGWRR